MHLPSLAQSGKKFEPYPNNGKGQFYVLPSVVTGKPYVLMWPGLIPFLRKLCAGCHCLSEHISMRTSLYTKAMSNAEMTSQMEVSHPPPKWRRVSPPPMQVWVPHPFKVFWPWPWLFKVKYGICYISNNNGPIAMKRKVNILIEL